MAEQTRVTVNIAGALKKLSLAARYTSDLTTVLEGPINQSMDQFFRRQFDSEGAYGGGQRWKTWAPATVKLRRRRGHGRGGIGRDTNEMWASLTKLGLGPHAILAVTPHSIERGTDLPYSRWFSEGYLSKTYPVFNRKGQAVFLRRRVPKQIAGRPIVPENMPGTLVAAWEKYIVNFVQRA